MLFQLLLPLCGSHTLCKLYTKAVSHTWTASYATQDQDRQHRVKCSLISLFYYLHILLQPGALHSCLCNMPVCRHMDHYSAPYKWVHMNSLPETTLHTPKSHAILHANCSWGPGHYEMFEETDWLSGVGAQRDKASGVQRGAGAADRVPVTPSLRRPSAAERSHISPGGQPPG